MNRNPIAVGAVMIALGAALGVMVLVTSVAQWSDTTNRLGIPTWLLAPACIAVGSWYVYKGIRQKRQR